MIETDLVPTGEAAQILGVSAAALRYQVRHHRITPARRTPGGHAMFDRATLAHLAATLSRGNLPAAEQEAALFVASRNATFPASWRNPQSFMSPPEAVPVGLLPADGVAVAGSLDVTSSTSR